MLVARGVLARHEAKERHEPARRLEATEVVQLRHERHRRDRVDAAKAAEPPTGSRYGSVATHRTSFSSSRTKPLLEMLDRLQIVPEAGAIGLVLEAQAPKPAAMRLGPRLPA